jgi:hypothetical protein
VVTVTDEDRREIRAMIRAELAELRGEVKRLNVIATHALIKANDALAATESE